MCFVQPFTTSSRMLLICTHIERHFESHQQYWVMGSMNITQNDHAEHSCNVCYHLTSIEACCYPSWVIYHWNDKNFTKNDPCVNITVGFSLLVWHIELHGCTGPTNVPTKHPHGKRALGQNVPRVKNILDWCEVLFNFLSVKTPISWQNGINKWEGMGFTTIEKLFKSGTFWSGDVLSVHQAKKLSSTSNRHVDTNKMKKSRMEYAITTKVIMLWSCLSDEAIWLSLW